MFSRNDLRTCCISGILGLSVNRLGARHHMVFALYIWLGVGAGRSRRMKIVRGGVVGLVDCQGSHGCDNEIGPGGSVIRHFFRWECIKDTKDLVVMQE